MGITGTDTCYGVAGGFVVANSSTISSVSGTLALIPGPQSVVFGGIAVVTGVIAVGNDAQQHDYAAMALDGAATVIGGAGVTEDILAGAKADQALTAFNTLTSSQSLDSFNQGVGQYTGLSIAQQQAEALGKSSDITSAQLGWPGLVQTTAGAAANAIAGC